MIGSQDCVADPFKVLFDEAVKTVEDDDNLIDIPMIANPFFVRYKIGKLLGEGVNGTVYTAVDNNTDSTVAMKFLTFENSNPGECHALRELTSLRSLTESSFVLKYNFIELYNNETF